MGVAYLLGASRFRRSLRYAIKAVTSQPGFGGAPPRPHRRKARGLFAVDSAPPSPHVAHRPL
eukprot:343541-Lingulodinium_polyedra.AAC.1